MSAFLKLPSDVIVSVVFHVIQLCSFFSMFLDRFTHRFGPEIIANFRYHNLHHHGAIVLEFPLSTS